jgi:hypothetical protein
LSVLLQFTASVCSIRFLKLFLQNEEMFEDPKE